MPKVVFFFAGTGRTAEEYQREHEGFLGFPEDVIRIYVNGCQDFRVGGLGGAVSPDLEVATDKIMAAFSDDEAKLNLVKLKKTFGDAIIVSSQDQNVEVEIEVESLALEGYSRGAVQTLAVASALKKKKFDPPIDLIANQPVTGEKYGKKSLFNDYKNLALAENIRSATTLFAMHETQVNPLHDRFFTTMRPTFAKGTKLREILLPQQIHKRSAVVKSLNCCKFKMTY